MENKYVKVAILSLVIVTCSFLFYKFAKIQNDTDLAYRLVNDIGDYYQANKSLPQNWYVFVEWVNINHKTRGWHADELARRFAINPWYVDDKNSNKTTILRIKDPSLKPNEENLNRVLIERLRAESWDAHALPSNEDINHN